ncbi:response regulator [Desulfovibrio sp. UCD-KL4C]|uniref:response regulator n=1 Tax=Desulfovibrio sp. UCD-KL4C TaxID=2578120 RepID=UPI0025C2E009|nr:response regulator [Desulfovibrio sp. UCD-KL4C]
MSGNSQKQTILVVDDTSSNIAIFSKILSSEFRIKAAKNGPKALEISFETPPDIILLDIMMPKMDGYEVCRKLKLTPKTKDIPIIFVTAMVDAENKSRALELGAVDFITKPINPSIVLERIRKHLQIDSS